MSLTSRRLITNFSKGELSRLIEGRPDLAAFFEGGRVVENWDILRQGGASRRVGTRFVAEVKDSTKDAILLPFETSVDDAYILEVGVGYIRMFKNGIPILDNTLGATLVTNGAFATDLGGWINAAAGAGNSITWNAGQMMFQITNLTPTVVCRTRQIIATTPGTSYLLIFQIVTAQMRVWVSTVAGTGLGDIVGIQAYDPGFHSIVFTAPGSSVVIEFGMHEDITGLARLDNVSLHVVTAAVLVEITSPYTEPQLRNLHFTQSVDVMWLFHPDVAQRELSRLSDISWQLAASVFDPPPSFEADTDVSDGTCTLTPSATSGNNVTFTMSQAKLIPGDEGRMLVSGIGRAIVKTLPSAGSLTFTADIVDSFASTATIPAGSWFLRLPPQTTLDPDIKGPEGAQVTLLAGKNAFRTADIGKFISIYGGLIRITIRVSGTEIRGEILSELTATGLADPAAAPSGAWTLEVSSWSSTNGFPRTGDFIQGRLGQAATYEQPTTFWLSRSNDFRNYAIGILADDAIDYTIASRQLNRIEWLTDNVDLFIGTAGAELRVTAGSSDEALGGDKVPLVSTQSKEGSTSIQPIIVGRRIVFVDRSRRKIFSEAFQIEEDGYDALELTGAAEHITESGIRLGPLAFARRPDPRLFFVREDGQLVTLTYHRNEKVIGFTRYVTDGQFQAVAVIPRPLGGPDQVWVIVQRFINGQVKRYIEFLESAAADLPDREWISLQTDCAKVYDLTERTTIFEDLEHLEGATVDVIADGAYIGTRVVEDGRIEILEGAESHVEVGLHYDSTLQTMRPSIEGQMLEGVPRNWIKLWLRVKDTIGGKINGQRILYPPSPLDTKNLHNGDVDVTAYENTSTEGYITIVQDQPYPITILAAFGEIEFADHS